jgi:nucleotidyltransferase substrate binding protein (TIGR01987 family)
VQNTIFGIDISSALRAYAKFEQFRKNLDSEQQEAGAVQAFEYTYELCWKTMKRLLATKGIITNSPRDTFRAAALVGFIADPEPWFNFLEIRNITVHTYEQAEAQRVIAAFDDFSKEVSTFLKSIGALDATD